MSDLSKRLRERLGGVEAAPFYGDNLAIFLASEFEPGIESEEMDESGTWKQGAIDATDQVLDAIHGHYHDALDAKDREIAELTRDIASYVDANTALLAKLEEAEKALAMIEGVKGDVPAERFRFFAVVTASTTLSSLRSK